MNITRERPPVYEEIKQVFGLDFDKGGFSVAYGDTIHDASGHVPPDLMIHEAVHRDQQAAHRGGIKGWWRDYLRSPSFRLQQEVEAYCTQYLWMLENTPKHQHRARLFMYATALSSKMYGELVSFHEAYSLVQGPLRFKTVPILC